MNKKNNPIGIRDIARLADASVASVSRVINNAEGISLKLRRKIQDVIDEYGYVPNMNAKNLQFKRSNVIALFVHDMTNPYYASLMQHLNRIAFEKGYMLLVCDTGVNFERQYKYYKYCKAMRTAGIIFTENSVDDPFELDNSDDTPVVFVGGVHSLLRPACHISFDTDYGMGLLVDYLTSLNHKKIGFIRGPSHMLTSSERLGSFLKYMRKKGLDVPDRYLFKTDAYTTTYGLNAYGYFLSLTDKPTAIIASNDTLARGFIMGAFSHGFGIPDQFSVCGIDAVDNDSLYPKITSIKQDTEKLANYLFTYLMQSDESQHQDIVIEVTLSIGNTCKSVQ